MSTRFLTVFALAGLCAATLPGDEPPTRRQPQPLLRQAPATGLGYSVKLEFQIVHPEDTPTFFTHSAGGQFAVSHDIAEPNHEHSVEIAGMLSPPGDDGRLLAQYDVQTHHSDLNEGFSAVHGASGSIVLTPGKMTTLTLLGDAELRVTATRDE